MIYEVNLQGAPVTSDSLYFNLILHHTREHHWRLFIKTKIYSELRCKLLSEFAAAEVLWRIILPPPPPVEEDEDDAEEAVSAVGSLEEAAEELIGA